MGVALGEVVAAGFPVKLACEHLPGPRPMDHLHDLLTASGRRARRTERAHDAVGDRPHEEPFDSVLALAAERRARALRLRIRIEARAGAGRLRGRAPCRALLTAVSQKAGVRADPTLTRCSLVVCTRSMHAANSPARDCFPAARTSHLQHRATCCPQSIVLARGRCPANQSGAPSPAGAFGICRKQLSWPHASVPSGPDTSSGSRESVQYP